jgi:hypothetical protein
VITLWISGANFMLDSMKFFSIHFIMNLPVKRTECHYEVESRVKYVCSDSW